MNLLRLPWIDQIGSADDVAVGYHLSSLQLLLAQSRALVAIDIVVIIGSYLDEIERNLTQLEVAPPLLDKDFQPLGILAGKVSHVGTSLIEEDSLNGIVEDGRESAIAPDERTQIVVDKLFHAGHGVEALLGVFFQVVGIEPALHTCPALIGEDKPHGNVESLVDGFGEKPACGRAVADGRGRYSIPVARSVVELFHAHHGRNLHVADAAILARSHHLVVVSLNRTVAKALDGHFHVALPGTHPHLAAQDIAERDLFAIVKRDGQWAVAGLRGAHGQKKFSVFAGLGLGCFVRPRSSDTHRGSGFVPAPKAHVGILLHNHSVTQKMRKTHFGVGQHRRQPKQCSKRQ